MPGPAANRCQRAVPSFGEVFLTQEFGCRLHGTNPGGAWQFDAPHWWNRRPDCSAERLARVHLRGRDARGNSRDGCSTNIALLPPNSRFIRLKIESNVWQREL